MIGAFVFLVDVFWWAVLNVIILFIMYKAFTFVNKTLTEDPFEKK